MSMDHASQGLIGEPSDRERSARELVGKRLRRLRLERNKTLEDAARVLDSHKAKVSRMENGLAPLRRRDVIDLLILYGVTDPNQQSVLVSVATGQREPGWWFADDMPLEETVLWANEQHADLIRTYQPHLIPELLRTEEYARAAHLAVHYPSSPPAATETAVKNLMRRQQARSAKVWAVIDEPVLWRPIGNDLDMHLRQLDALAAITSSPDVGIQIVPLDSPFLPAAEAFTIFRLPDKHVLSVHRYTGDEVTELAAADENYGLLFDQLISVASRRREAPHILARVADGLRARHHQPEGDRS